MSNGEQGTESKEQGGAKSQEPGAGTDGWDIVAQERAVVVLRRAVEDPARLSHAYLFAGPEHVGRATVARRFAQALSCEQALHSVAEPFQARADGEAGKPRLRGHEVPCGQCRACRLIEEGKHPDIEWVTVGGLCDESDHRDHAADNSRDIRICQLRRIERLISLTTIDARWRVVIIDPAEAMTVEAANAFLKTLEEPAPNTVLVLITAHEEQLRETVRSRCRRVVFQGVPRHEMEVALRERWGAEAGQAADIARLAQGRLGWAVSVLQDERLLIERERLLDEIESVVAGGYSQRFSYAGGLAGRFQRDPQAVRGALEGWSAWWRDVLVAAAGQEALAAETGRLDTLRAYAAQYGVTGAIRALSAVNAGRRHLEEHASPLLALEAMLLEIPVVSRR